MQTVNMLEAKSQLSRLVESVEFGSTDISNTVSLWEIAIKHKLARGDMPIDSANALQYFKLAGYQILNILSDHVIATADLPAHHQNPFDRLLVAQALQEP